MTKIESHLNHFKLLKYLRPVPVTCAASAIAVIHYVWMVSLPHRELVCFIADDAFYELQVARHFLHSGEWSFDGGYTTTTGFHLLNVYLMSLFPQILERPWLAIRFWMAVGLVLSILSAFIITNFMYKKFGAFALITAFLIVTAPTFILQNTGLLDFPYVVLISALYASAIFLWHGEGRARIYAPFLLGFLGSVARSDFGGLPFAIALVCSTAYLFRDRNAYLTRSLCGLAGAAVGLIFDFVHNFLFSGHFLSDSAMTKALWGKRVGYSLGRPFILPVSTLTSSKLAFGLVLMFFWALLMIRLIATALGNDRSSTRGLARQMGLSDRGLLASCGGCAILLYLLVYGLDSSLQPWYVANFVLPVVFVVGNIGHLALRYRISLTYVVGSVAVLLCVNILNTYRPTWNDQRYRLDMAEYLQDHKLVGRIGGWNVGLVGYFTDGRIINLDGLINDQIYSYAADARLEEYIDQAQIRYLVDYPLFISDQANARRLGFTAKSIASRLKPLHEIVSKDRDDPWVDYTLYELRASPPKAQVGMAANP